MNTTALRRVGRLSAAFALLLPLVVGVLTVGVKPAHAAIGGKRAAILMPFSGGGATLGNNTLPAVHANYYYPWSQDLAAVDGTAVQARFQTADGNLTLSVLDVQTLVCTVSTTNPTPVNGGKVVFVKVMVDGAEVGRVLYEHLDNVQVGIGQSISVGTTLGYTKWWSNSTCWQVSSAGGVHTHVEAQRGCYRSLAANTAYSGGTAVGMLSSNYGTANKSVCDEGEVTAVMTGAVTGGTTTIGSFDPTNAWFYLRNSSSTGTADMTAQIGNAGWIPIAGDWDGNGITTPGVYDPSNGWFYLRNSNSTGPADVSIQFGNAGWIPLPGDWDGNGIVTIGAYDPGAARFYLRNSNSTGAADLNIQYGNTGWVPVVGDWDGNGTTTIGVYDPSSAWYYLRNTNNAGTANYSIQFGNAGWTPIAGDWDGNGIVSIGAYDPSNAWFYLRNSNNTGVADIAAQFGNAGWKPVVGDWNGQ